MKLFCSVKCKVAYATLKYAHNLLTCKLYTENINIYSKVESPYNLVKVSVYENHAWQVEEVCIMIL